MNLILLLALCIAFIVVSSKYWRLHPFASLILAAFMYGGLAGMPLNDVADAINQGFGATVGAIGIVIVCGAIIAAILQYSGAAAQLAESLLRLTSTRRVPTTMGAVGYLVSLPVFCDSGFVLLSPVNRALAIRSGASYAACTTALALGLYATHTMVPPTPGPVAAAGILGADLGLVIAFGIPVSLIALFGGLGFAYWSASRIDIIPDPNGVAGDPVSPGDGHVPSLFSSLLPILMPILLILARSVIELPNRPLGEGALAATISFLGQPSVALIIGVVLAMRLPGRLSKSMVSDKGLFGEAVRAAAVIIVITGAGGAFGKVLQTSGIAEAFEQTFALGPFNILVPLLLAATIKTAQGSSTVAIITTAGTLAPVLDSLGLDSATGRSLAVVAIGAGSMIVSHANDSYFWVVSQFSGMSVQQGYRLQSLGTLVQGITAAIGIIVVELIFL